MNITYYPYEPFKVNNSKITILSTSSPSVYTKLIAGASGQDDTLHLSDDHYRLLEYIKGMIWIGEISAVDLNHLFQNKLIKKFTADLTDEQRQKVVNLNNELRATILEATFMYELALDIDHELDLQKLIKFCNLKFSNDVQDDPYGIIESIVQTAVELQETRIITLINVSHYLSINQFNELVRLVATLDVKLFIIEFSELATPDRYQECCYYHIDNDYVEWRYE